LAMILSHGSFANADLVFSIEQRNPGAITLGSIAVFDISVRASPSNITNLGGVTFFLGADDLGNVGGQTSGGMFRVGTNDPISSLAGNRTYLFTPSEGGFIGTNDSFAVFSASGSNRALTTGGGLLGSIQLDTTGASVGMHSLTFSELDGIDQTAFRLGGTFSGAAINYSITAVPEPSPLISAMCLGVVACVAFTVSCIHRETTLSCSWQRN
jgi:hypothetical protein